MEVLSIFDIPQLADHSGTLGGLALAGLVIIVGVLVWDAIQEYWS